MATASARPSRNFLFCVFELHPAPTMGTVDLFVIILVPAVIVLLFFLVAGARLI